jgi:hypothetical protein
VKDIIAMSTATLVENTDWDETALGTPESAELPTSKPTHTPPPIDLLAAEIQQAPSVDMQKVELVKQKIQNGEMDILKTGAELEEAADRLADKMQSFEQSLI